MEFVEHPGAEPPAAMRGSEGQRIQARTKALGELAREFGLERHRAIEFVSLVPIRYPKTLPFNSPYRI